MRQTREQHDQQGLAFASLMAMLGTAFVFTLIPDIAYAQAGSTNVDTMITRIIKQLSGDDGPILLITWIFYIAGIAMLGKGLMNGRKIAEGGQNGGMQAWMPTLIPVAVGSLLMVMPNVVQLIWESIALDQSTTIALQTSTEACTVDKTTIGGAICRVYSHVDGRGGGLMALINVISILVGLMLIGSALTGAYRMSTGAQGAPKLSGIVWRLIGGAMLMALPASIDLLRHSIFANPEDTSRFVFSQFDVVSGDGLDSALTSLVDNIRKPVVNITFFIMFVIGAATIARTLYVMSGINFEQNKMTTTAMVGRFIIGACLMSAWSIYHTAVFTILGTSNQGTAHTLAYSAAALDALTAQRVNNVMNAAFVWVQIVGMIAFFRGFLVLKNSLDGQQGTSLSAGLTHIIAGTLCINIPWTVMMIQNTIPGIKILNGNL